MSPVRSQRWYVYLLSSRKTKGRRISKNSIIKMVTIAGFAQGDTVLGLFPVNAADNILHLIIALIALWLGFGYKSAEARPAQI